MLAVVASPLAFSPQAPGSVPLTCASRTTSPACALQSDVNRRAALVGAGLTALASLPSFAVADEADDAIYQIAEKTRLKNEAAKEAEKARLATRRDKSRDNEGADIIVKAALGGSFFFSLPFFYKNLARLGLKFSSVVNKNIKEEDYKR